MRNLHAQSARGLFSASPVISIVIIAFIAVYPDVMTAQCPESPTTYPNGVVEGRVSPSSQRGQECAVAMDDQGRFVAVWLRLELGLPVSGRSMGP